MQPVAIEAGELIFPVGLPAGEDQLLQLPVRGNQHERRPGLEADAALDAERRLSHMDPTAEPVGLRQGVQPLDQRGPIERGSVQRHRHALAPGDHHLPRCGRIGRRLEQLVGRSGPGVVGPAPAPGRAPEPAVDRIGAGLRGNGEPPLPQVGHGLVAGHAEIADGGDDLELGCENPEGDVEADLVVPRPGGSVRHGRGTDGARGLDHRQRLLGALGGDAEGVDFPSEHVPLDQEADEAIEDGDTGVDLMVLGRADGAALCGDRGAVGHTRAARVHIDGVDGPAVVRESGHAEAGVEPAGEGEGERAARSHNALLCTLMAADASAPGSATSPRRSPG